MKKRKFHFNPQTLSFEPIVENAWRKLRRVLTYLLASAFGGAVFFLVYFTFFSSPREKQLQQERARMEAQYDLLSRQLDEMRAVMADLSARDNNLYRVMLQADSIPSSVRQLATGRAHYYDQILKMTNSELVVNISRQVNQMRRQIYVQSQSYDELAELVRSNQDRLAHTPAIQPVLNHDLTRMASGYGVRVDPVYHTRRMHDGMDFTAPKGTDIYATADGTVTTAEWKGGYGNCVEISHGYGYLTRYGHMSRIMVKPGQKVHRGDIIGLVGSTGKSTGPHVHYEVHLNGKVVNPANYYFQDLSPEQYDQMMQMANNAGQMMD